MPDRLSVKAEATFAAALTAAPWWVDILHQVNTVAATIASIAGAIVGCHAVWRLTRRKNSRSGDTTHRSRPF